MGHKNKKSNKGGKTDILNYGTKALSGIGTTSNKAINYPPGRTGLGGLQGYGTKKLKR